MLYETRLDYTDLGTFYGSDYFLDRVGGKGFSPEELPKRLGDAYLDTRLVRDAILREAGQRFLDPAVADDAAQMKALIDNAATAQRDLNLSYGIALSAAQIARLQQDIVWYVEADVDGQLTAGRDAALSAVDGAVRAVTRSMDLRPDGTDVQTV